MADSDAAETTGIGEVEGSAPELVEPAQAPEPAPERVKRAGFLPLVLGGAIAALLGFSGAYYLARIDPQAIGLAGSAGVEQRLSDHDKRLSDLAAAVAALPKADADPAAGDALRSDLAAERATVAKLVEQQQALEVQMADLAAKLQAQSERPAAAGGATAAEIAAATEAAVQKAKAAEDDAAQARTEAAAVAQKASVQAAVTRIQAAIESGAAFDTAISDLQKANVAVPDPLVAQKQGVPTLAALRSGFAPAARDALSASLAETAGGTLWDRMTAFLRSQTGARSLTPRTGSDPDAILSRAEAALGTGDLGAALTEIRTLSASGQARMSEWTGLAERRQAAIQAVATLTAEIK